MPNHATWRPYRRDPRTWVGWFARDARAPSLWVARRLAGVCFISSFVALIHGEWITAFTCFCIAGIPEMIVGMFSAMWGGRFQSVTNSFLPRPLPIQNLLTLPAPAPPFPCRIEVSKKSALLGSDVGVVTFVDGWLHFEGHRTSFALRRCDVSNHSVERLNLENGEAVTFESQDYLIAGEFVELDLKKRFVANLKSWMRSDPPAGEPVLPPAMFHPSGAVRVWNELMTAIASCLAAYAFLTWLDGAWWAPVLALPFLKGLVVSLVNFHRLERARCSALSIPAVE